MSFTVTPIVEKPGYVLGVHALPDGLTQSATYKLGCPTCEAELAVESTFFPRHDASRRCESGKREHCTCSTCF